METEELKDLTEKAKRIRRHIVRMTGLAGSGHPGGSLSCADIVTALYFKAMRHDAGDAGHAERDRFILSKGHAGPCLYAALAECGYFPVEDLMDLRRLGCHLQGHPDMNKTPGVEFSTGSLGQGLSIAVGMALANRLDDWDGDVFVLLGDGETQEGQVWEAAMSAAHYGLDHIIAFLDKNGFQIDGPVSEVMAIEPVADKWRAFGWEVQEIDGHDMSAILAAIEKARTVRGKPSMIVCRTVKGKGVSFMEGDNSFHGKVPSEEQVRLALDELE